MKKVLVIVMAALLLSSCIRSELPPLTEKEGSPVFTIEGGLPDIGEFSGKEKKRFYSEYTPDFIPSEEYGEIIPYVGSYKVFSSGEENPIEQGYGTYGFCTPDGRVVMDASSKTAFIYYRETSDGFGYYTVTREAEQREDAPDEYFANEMLVIPKSGAWCITLGRGAWVSNCSGGVITVCEYSDNYETVRGVFYDYSGNKIGEVDGEDSFGEHAFGMNSVYRWDKDGTQIRFIDLEGNTVLGPFAAATNFNSKGIAGVTDLSGDSYLIDTDGNRLTDGEYESINYQESDDGKKMAFAARCKDKSGTDIFDENGNRIGKLNTSKYVSLHFTKDGDIICNYNENGINYWKRLSDNSDFVNLEFSVAPGEYAWGNNTYVYKDAEAHKGIVFDGNGETIAVLEDFYSFGSISSDTKYAIYTSGEYDYSAGIDTLKTNIYDCESDKVVYSASGETFASFIGDGKRYATVSFYRENAAFGGAYEQMLYDLETNSVVLEDCMNIEHVIVGGRLYINVCTSNACTLYDEDMNIIMRTYNE